MIRMPTPRKPGRPRKPDSKRSQGVDRHANPRKAFHGPAKLFDALEAYLKDTRPMPSEAETLRTALEEFLKSRGYWPSPKGDAGS